MVRSERSFGAAIHERSRGPVACLKEWPAAISLSLALALSGLTAQAAEPAPTQTYFPGVMIPPTGGPGAIVDNSGLIPYDQAYFAFEVESVLSSLTEVPIWYEIEAMLDNPYAVAYDPDLSSRQFGQGGHMQGFPSYVSTLPRRRSYHYRDADGNPCAPGTPGCNEVPLPPLTVHPLNYNYMSGEELRLLNIEFEETEWEVPDLLIGPYEDHVDPTNAIGEYIWTYRPITVSAGEDRIEEDEAPLDFNSPIKPDEEFSLISVELIPAEGARITGRDPGEPGYAGFGILNDPALRSAQYSTPAFPMNAFPVVQQAKEQDITAPIPGGPDFGTGTRRLFDPVRGFIDPRNPITGSGGLRKPSLGIPEAGGTPANPNFLANSEEQLAERRDEAVAEDPEASEDPQAYLLHSNEIDYLRRPGAIVAGIPSGREAAIVLGKALFWDMQVGSDSVQACGSCHFKAGADDRVKNQVNPDHLGADLTFQIRQPNESLTASDFPFHKLIDPDEAGENPANVARHVNDVASSMGVVFHNFVDIPPIGDFSTPSMGVSSVLPDIGQHVPDPIPGFNDPITGLSLFRRVEPRNTPTIFGADFNFDNFWDGRARHDFNGGSAFGASDPQAHVWVNDGGTLVPTRQIIRVASLASLATGPALSEFEMSFLGRNWQKIGKKLLQAGARPLANQIVDPDDSILGPYSAQRAGPGGPVTFPGRPGLNRTYAHLIRAAYHPRLWENITQHLDGGYTDGRLPAGTPRPIAILADTDGDGNGDVLDEANTDDPFDHYVLAAAAGRASPRDTNEFTQMEANFSLFFGLSTHIWASILIPDDTPMDHFYQANPDAFLSFGEANERWLVLDLLPCGQINPLTGQPQGQPCFTEVGNFKRDPDVQATLGCLTENCTEGTVVPVDRGATRQPDDPDPLFGMDLFLGSNLSLKNPFYRTFRCGECHASAGLTDHTVDVSYQLSFNDFAPEFGEPSVAVFPEPLGRSRTISGFNLESEINGNAQDGIERNIADFALDNLGGPQGQALFDNGVYNIGVTPIADDIGRGGNDGFGWPLSLGVLALKNIGGVDYTPGGHLAADGFTLPPTPGNPLPNWDPSADIPEGPAGNGRTGGGIFEPTVQDQQLNPGFEEDLEGEVAQLPAFLAKWASNINVGDETQQDEVFVGLNTLCAEPILEGFVDSFGPVNPAATVGETYNIAYQPEMATWPVVNRVNRFGSFKAPSLRNVELTGPYFHDGGNLTLRQQLDFYLRGGNFPFTNSSHRDFLIAHLNIEDEALGPDAVNGEVFTEEEKEHAKVALIDFLLELTDERVRWERAPFDRPELFIPLDGAAPMNTFGRDGFLDLDDDPATGSGAVDANPMFRHIPAVGQGGRPPAAPGDPNTGPLTNFLGVSSTPVAGPNNDHYDR